MGLSVLATSCCVHLRTYRYGYSPPLYLAYWIWYAYLGPYPYHSCTHIGGRYKWTVNYPGLLKPATREKWERDLFGGCYDGAKAFRWLAGSLDLIVSDIYWRLWSIDIHWPSPSLYFWSFFTIPMSHWTVCGKLDQKTKWGGKKHQGQLFLFSNSSRLF